MIGLNESVDKYRPTWAEGDEGEDVLTLPGSATASDLECRIVTVSLADKAHMEAIGIHYGEEKAYIFLFDDGTDIAVDDHLLYGSEYYRVLTAEDPDKMGHHLEVLGVHVQGVTA